MLMGVEKLDTLLNETANSEPRGSKASEIKEKSNGGFYYEKGKKLC